MFRLGLKSIVIVAVLMSSLVVCASEANAFWGYYGMGGYGGWGCGANVGCWNGYAAPCAYSACSPCATSCDPCEGGSWYLGYRPGPLRRVLLGHCRWYWGGGNCVDACCPTGGASCGECSSCAPAPVISTPVIADPSMTPTPAMPGPATSPAPTLGTPTAPAPGFVLPDSTLIDSHTSGLLTIWVPSDAKVTVNGMVTKSIGSKRQFVSYGLNPGYGYRYEICAEVVRDGKPVIENRTVVLQAGSRSSVAFGFNVKPNEELAAR